MGKHYKAKPWILLKMNISFPKCYLVVLLDISENCPLPNTEYSSVCKPLCLTVRSLLWSSYSTARFLNLDTINILDWQILGCGGCLVHHRVLANLQCYSLEARISLLPPPDFNNQNCLQRLLDVPRVGG